MSVDGEGAGHAFSARAVKNKVQRGEAGHAVTLDGLDDERSKQAADALRGDVLDERGHSLLHEKR